MWRIVALLILVTAIRLTAQQEQHYLYVAVPGDEADADRSIRVLVFEISDAHRFLKRIVLWRGAGPAGPGGIDDRETVRGIAASAKNGRELTPWSS